MIPAATKGRMLLAVFDQSCWVSLHTGDPGETGEHEVSGGGYTRHLIPFTPPMNGQRENRKAVEYPEMPAAHLTHIGLWSKRDVGEMLWSAELEMPQTMGEGDIFRFQAGAIQLTLESMR